MTVSPVREEKRGKRERRENLSRSSPNYVKKKKKRKKSRGREKIKEKKKEKESKLCWYHGLISVRRDMKSDENKE